MKKKISELIKAKEIAEVDLNKILTKLSSDFGLHELDVRISTEKIFIEGKKEPAGIEIRTEIKIIL